MSEVGVCGADLVAFVTPVSLRETRRGGATVVLIGVVGAAERRRGIVRGKRVVTSAHALIPLHTQSRLLDGGLALADGGDRRRRP